MKKFDYAISILFILIGIGMFYFTRHFPFYGRDDIGPGYWPRILGVILISLSVLLIIKTSISSVDASKYVDFSSKGVRRVFLVLIASVFFGIILKYLGMIIAVLFFIPACIAIIGVRSKIKIGSVTIGIVAFIFVVFELLLNIQLPRGIL